MSVKARQVIELMSTRNMLTIDDTQLDEGIGLDTFRACFRRHPAGTAVISASSSFGPVGMTISSLATVSADPPIVMFSLSRQSFPTQGILESDTAVLHLLDSRDKWLGVLGATGGASRFSDTSQWDYLPTGEPVYTAASQWVRVKILQQTEVGTGVVVIAHVIDAKNDDANGTDTGEISPLAYVSRQWHRLCEDSLMDS